MTSLEFILIRREGRCESMKVVHRASCCLASALAATVVGVATPASAEPGVNVFPGMEIRQGSTVCTLGMVEMTLRIALATGQCDGGSTVTDSNGNVLGGVVTARHNAATPAADGSSSDVEYEVIKLADDVRASDVLPTGRQLQSKPGARAQQADWVCHFGISTRETCGRVGGVSDNKFVITGVASDGRDVGGPVYTLTDDNRAVIVGLYEGTAGSGPTAESWQAVMQQLYIDGQSPGKGPMRIAGWHH
jgi:hypothetical protein